MLSGLGGGVSDLRAGAGRFGLTAGLGLAAGLGLTAGSSAL
jgi:hypothetical protein